LPDPRGTGRVGDGVSANLDKKMEMPASVEADPIGWIARAEKFRGRRNSFIP